MTIRLCLGMLVRDESARIERAIASVRDQIDHWVIYDTGSADATRVRAGTALAGISGEYQAALFTDFAMLRNDLIAQAAPHADFVLLLDADETLAGAALDLAPYRDAPAIGLEVGNAEHAFVQPRIVSTTGGWQFEGPVYEFLVHPPAMPRAHGAHVHHHQDGSRWHRSDTAGLDLAQLKTALQYDAANVRLQLGAALANERLTDWQAAADQYDQARAATSDDTLAWFALYRGALAHRAGGSTAVVVAERLAGAFDLKPEHAEPLYHLARLHYALNEPARARAISELALEIPPPNAAFYIERPVYEYHIALQHAEFCAAAGDHTAALDQYDRLLGGTLSTRIRKKTLQLRAAASGTAAPAKHKARPVPAATPRGTPKFLTIGMATYDDFDGAYFSIQAIRMYHPEITDETEILVIDNHPDGACAEPLKNLDSSVRNYRYVPNNTINGTAVRDLIFREAAGEVVLCMDSHVLVVPGALQRLIDYYRAHPDSMDLLQGPLLSDSLARIQTHFNPDWSSGMYGMWGTDERGQSPDGEPFDIPMQGLGLFSCRRTAWLGFNPHFRGFGGEEGYIHEKFHQAGRRTLCLPFLRWLHRFARPMGVPYANRWEDRIRNYVLGFSELGMDVASIRTHFAEHVNPDVADRVCAATLAEIAGPFHFFDAIYCINLDSQTERWEAIQTRFQRLGIAARVRRFPAVATPDNHHVGCALSHRRIIAEAHILGYRNVLVFEDDALFLDKCIDELRPNIADLENIDWNVFYLGACRWGRTLPKAPGCTRLRSTDKVTCCHAVAYNRPVFERILADIPNTEKAVAHWLTSHYGVDQYLRHYIEKCYAASPALATREPIRKLEDPLLNFA